MSGTWSVAIAPLPHEPRRFAATKLLPMLEEASVALRGWNYPHVPRRDRNDITSIPNGIEGRTDWERYLEKWRFHVDGLFTHRWRMREDGTAYQGTLHAVSTIWSITEIWEFARRLYGSDRSVEAVHVKVELEGLQGRTLSADGFEDLPVGAEAKANVFRREETVTRESLEADAAEHASLWATELFEEIGIIDISQTYVHRKVMQLLRGEI